MYQTIPYKFNSFPVYYYNGGSPEPPDPLTTPLTFTAKAASNIVLSTVGTPYTTTLQYSKNGGTWTNYTSNKLISLANGETVAFSGANDQFNKNTSNYYRFQITGSVEAYGNIQSLMNWSTSCALACYRNLFSGCTALVKAPLLAATTVN